MKAAVVKNNNIVIEEVEKPILHANGAIIKVLGCGLCGSDIVKFKNHIKDGTVLGHEVVGEIVEIKSTTGFVVGDKISLGHHIPCFECIYCKNGNYSMCKHFKETNIFPGGFAEYIFVSEEHLKNTVFKLSKDMDELTASFTEPLACCVRAVKRANLIANSTAMIIGLGSIGLLMGQAVKAFGHKVVGADLIEERLQLAKKVNFDEVIKSNDIFETEKFVKKCMNEEGVDAVFMTSGAYQAIPLAIKCVRSGGKIVVFSSVKNLDGYANNDIYYKELTVLGSYSPSPADLRESFELLKSRKVLTDGFSTVYEFDKIQKAFDDTIDNEILKAYIKL